MPGLHLSNEQAFFLAFAQVNVYVIIINYIIVLVEAVFVAPRSEELGIAT